MNFLVPGPYTKIDNSFAGGIMSGLSFVIIRIKSSDDFKSFNSSRWTDLNFSPPTFNPPLSYGVSSGQYRMTLQPNTIQLESLEISQFPKVSGPFAAKSLLRLENFSSTPSDLRGVSAAFGLEVGGSTQIIGRDHSNTADGIVIFKNGIQEQIGGEVHTEDFYNLEIRRGSDNIIRFIIDSVEVGTVSNSGDLTRLFMLASNGGGGDGTRIQFDAAWDFVELNDNANGDGTGNQVKLPITL